MFSGDIKDITLDTTLKVYLSDNCKIQILFAGYETSLPYWASSTPIIQAQTMRTWRSLSALMFMLVTLVGTKFRIVRAIHEIAYAKQDGLQFHSYTTAFIRQFLHFMKQLTVIDNNFSSIFQTKSVLISLPMNSQIRLGFTNFPFNISYLPHEIKR